MSLFFKIIYEIFFKETPNIGVELQISYIGCYTDSLNRDLDGYHFSDLYMTIGYCAGRCLALNFLYCGLQH